MPGPNDKTSRVYIGLEEDLKHGMTPSVKLILDAKVFGILGDEETCKGWRREGIQALYDKTSKAWEPFGFLPSRLTPQLRERHAALFDAAVKTAKANGWDPDAELNG